MSMRISQEEIDKCIKLLHPDYQDCPVYVFHNFWDHVKWSFNHSYLDFQQLKKSWKGQTSGVYQGDCKFIQIYVFNHKVDDRYVKQNVIHTLYHELRHYYQYTYKVKKWTSRKVVSYSWGDPKYNESDDEKDANKFADRMMEKYREEISRVLNVYPDWDILGR